MHADTLYHRMLDQEKAIEAAKEAGQPIPSFPPILSQSRSPKPTLTPPFSTPSSSPLPEIMAEKQQSQVESSRQTGVERDVKLTEEARAELRKRTKDQPEIVKELEERAMHAEAVSDLGVAKRVNELTKARDQARKERREKGEATVGDTVSGWFGW